MHNFKELGIWKKSRELTLVIYRLLGSFSEHEKYAISSQIKRSVISISSNIAEGAGRESNNDFNHFLSIALGSSFELESQLIIAGDLNYIKNDLDYQQTMSQLKEVQKMIFGFKKMIKSKNAIA